MTKVIIIPMLFLADPSKICIESQEIPSSQSELKPEQSWKDRNSDST